MTRTLIAVYERSSPLSRRMGMSERCERSETFICRNPEPRIDETDRGRRRRCRPRHPPDRRGRRRCRGGPKRWPGDERLRRSGRLLVYASERRRGRGRTRRRDVRRRVEPNDGSRRASSPHRRAKRTPRRASSSPADTTRWTRRGVERTETRDSNPGVGRSRRPRTLRQYHGERGDEVRRRDGSSRSDPIQRERVTEPRRGCARSRTRRTARDARRRTIRRWGL